MLNEKNIVKAKKYIVVPKKCGEIFCGKVVLMRSCDNVFLIYSYSSFDGEGEIREIIDNKLYLTDEDILYLGNDKEVVMTCFADHLEVSSRSGNHAL